MSVRHGTHDAICLCCQHCDFDGGSPGYSSWTPGSPMTFVCDKKHWDLDYGGQEDAHLHMLKAQTCPDFKPRDTPAEPSGQRGSE